MHRRDFIKGSCGICIALSTGLVMSAILESCASALSIVKAKQDNNLVRIPAADFDHNPFKLLRVDNYDYDIAIQKEKDGTYTALLLMCTHANQPLTRAGDNYYCTNHGSQFDHSGNVTKGPAEKHLVKLHTLVKDNELFIHLITI
ncbi:MAG: Rieske (2Fe-2S) protein [Taibaiella sp.]|nr:Rieske (2Fe-2S) protein [Taibaiella sp.]